MEKDGIFDKIKELMISAFELDPAIIAPEKHLSEDLGLDSLDMADLLLNLEDHLGERIDPDLFKEARTVKNIVDSISPLWK